MAGEVVSGIPDLGGAVKPSAVLGGISGVAAAASAIPALNIIAAPLSAITGLAATIAKLFGGSLTKREMDMVQHIRNRVHTRNSLL